MHGEMSGTNCTPGSSSSFCGQEQAGSLSPGAGRSFVGPFSFCSWNNKNTSSALCCWLKSSSAFPLFPLLTVKVIDGMFSSCFAAFLCSPRLWETSISSCFHTASPFCSSTSSLFESAAVSGGV